MSHSFKPLGSLVVICCHHVPGWKDSLKTKPTFTRVTEVTPLAQNRRCILIFTNACCVNLFTIEVGSFNKKVKNFLMRSTYILHF